MGREIFFLYAGTHMAGCLQWQGIILAELLPAEGEQARKWTIIVDF